MPILDDLFQLYHNAAFMDYIGEPISQLAHMQQAAFLAAEAGADDELILAAFFHDLGHLCAPQTAPQMAGLGVMNHEQIGGNYLHRLGFSERIVQLVQQHVQAKRYLCWKNPKHFERLSEASKGTLEFQGGVMNDAEALTFRQTPLFRDILRLRIWDEAAKEIDGQGLSLQEIEELAYNHLNNGSPIYAT